MRAQDFEESARTPISAAFFGETLAGDGAAAAPPADLLPRADVVAGAAFSGEILEGDSAPAALAMRARLTADPIARDASSVRSVAQEAFFGERIDADASLAGAGPPVADERRDGEVALVPAAPVAERQSVSLFVAAHRTIAQRHSDFYLDNGKPRRRALAVSARLRRQDDSNFTNRTRFLARRVAEIGRPVSAPVLSVVATGDEFLAALVAASRNGPIANLVVYGHAAPNALFMREDRGFYGSVMDVAKTSRVVSGEEVDKDEQLRHVGARDLSDFEHLVNRGDIRFARNAVIVFAGCGVAGKRDIEPRSIAARMAEISGARVIASVDVTDQSMARGRDFRNKEYSRRTWVRFVRTQPPERLNTKVIDALQQLNFEGEAVAAIRRDGG